MAEFIQHRRDPQTPKVKKTIRYGGYTYKKMIKTWKLFSVGKILIQAKIHIPFALFRRVSHRPKFTYS